MYALYEEKENRFEIHEHKNTHIGPHIHEAMEIVYVTKGSLVLGVGTELYAMETGDMAFLFPNVIHHYQVFGGGPSRGIYLLAPAALSGSFMDTLTDKIPENPIIKKEELHPDIVYAIKALYKDRKNSSEVLQQAFLQVILSRAFDKLHFIPKESISSGDLIYRTVAYIAKHFKEEITLTSMAKDLYVSPYALSRIFSSTFHMNFNKYLNTTRLQYAAYLLVYTDISITDAYLQAGFESQRTFNRVFSETYHLTPRQFRNTRRAELAADEGDAVSD